VFDIGMPEFMVIAVVALVVLGPERLPELMGRIGRTYRQLRQMSDEVTGEFRRQWEEGMREVEDVTSTVNSALQGATAGAPTPPPPPLAQPPPALQAPQSAADAGPWTLHAWYRDTVQEAQPEAPTYPHSPFALPRAVRPADQLVVGGFGGYGSAAPSGPPPEPEDLVDLAPDALMADLPEVPEPPRGTEATVAPLASEGATDLHVEPAMPRATIPLNGQGTADGATATLRAAAPPLSGAAGTDGSSDGMDDRGTPGALSERERTIIELYRSGGISLERAAEFLAVGPEQFQALLRQPTRH
jgi:sec-independent protein translocase protein TatB